MAVHAGRGRGNSHHRLKSKMAAKGGYPTSGYGGRGGDGGCGGGVTGNAGDGFHGNSHFNNRRGCHGDVKKEKSNNNNKNKPPTIITDLANANGEKIMMDL